MIVSWMTTNKCNLKCRHCYQDAGDCRERELTTAEARKLIDEIARAGFRIMIFSGGEPLMRPDIYELVSYAASRGLRPVFGTNGTLITPEVARRLKESGAAAMGISLDSLDAQKHNAFRGCPDAYEKTIIQLFSASVVLIPYLLLTEDLSAVQADSTAVIMTLTVGLVHTGAAYAMYFGSMQDLKAQSAAVLSYIDPVSALLLSAVFLNERLTAAGIAGAVLIIGSALISELGPKK